MKSPWILGAVLCLATVSFMDPAAGTDRFSSEATKLTASDSDRSDRFGASVSLDGDLALIGVSFDDDLAEKAGSAYVYRFDGTTWVEQQKLVASDVRRNSLYGDSVSLSGDVALIGAYFGGGRRRGVVYVQRHDGTRWVEEQRITAIDFSGEEGFGRSVSVDGNVALIGSWFDDDLGDESGSAYVYRFDGMTWVEEQKLTASDGQARDVFGIFASLDGDVAVVGTLVLDGPNEFNGPVYVYRFDGTTWVEEQILSSGEGYGLGRVAVSGDVILVGAPDDPARGDRTGAAFVFRFDGTTWVKEQTLTASDGATQDSFGWSVSLDGNVAVIGAHGDRGAAYVYHFDGTTWAEVRKMTANDGAPGDEFGFSVSVSDNVALVGAHYQGLGGAAYVFESPEPTCRPVRVADVLFLNGQSGRNNEGVVEYNVVRPFQLSVRRPAAVQAPDTAPFVVYLWSQTPDSAGTNQLPFGLGCFGLPIPLSGGREPSPAIIWNNAMRHRLLGAPTRSSQPAPSDLVNVQLLPRIGLFYVQGLIFDPGSTALIPASVTNGIVGRPVFMR